MMGRIPSEMDRIDCRVFLDKYGILLNVNWEKPPKETVYLEVGPILQFGNVSVRNGRKSLHLKSLIFH